MYRENWISGVNPFREPVTLKYIIRFDDGVVVERSESLAPGVRWAIRVDDFHPNVTNQMNVNAVVTFTALKKLPLQVALWHSPIGRGVIPVVYSVSWECM